MGMLSVVFVVLLAVSVINGLPVLKGSYESSEVVFRRIGYIKSIGLFALMLGVLGQMIGLFDAFRAIEQMGSVSPAMLAGGLKVSMITTLYGLLIAVVAYLVWLGLSLRLKG